MPTSMDGHACVPCTNVLLPTHPTPAAAATTTLGASPMLQPIPALHGHCLGMELPTVCGMSSTSLYARLHTCLHACAMPTKVHSSPQAVYSTLCPYSYVQAMRSARLLDRAVSPPSPPLCPSLGICAIEGVCNRLTKFFVEVAAELRPQSSEVTHAARRTHVQVGTCTRLPARTRMRMRPFVEGPCLHWATQNHALTPTHAVQCGTRSHTAHARGARVPACRSRMWRPSISQGLDWPASCVSRTRLAC